MLATNRQRRVLLRNALIFAGFVALAVLLGVPAKSDTPRVGAAEHQNVPGVRFS